MMRSGEENRACLTRGRQAKLLVDKNCLACQPRVKRVVLHNNIPRVWRGMSYSPIRSRWWLRQTESGPRRDLMTQTWTRVNLNCPHHTGFVSRKQMVDSDYGAFMYVGENRDACSGFPPLHCRQHLPWRSNRANRKRVFNESPIF